MNSGENNGWCGDRFLLRDIYDERVEKEDSYYQEINTLILLNAWLRENGKPDCITSENTPTISGVIEDAK